MAGLVRPVKQGESLDSFNQFSAGQKSAIFGHKAQSVRFLYGKWDGKWPYVFLTLYRVDISGAEAQSNGDSITLLLMMLWMRSCRTMVSKLVPWFTAKGLESIRGSIKRGLANAEKNEIPCTEG